MALEDKIDDVIAEEVKAVFAAYIGNLAGGMDDAAAEAKFNHAMGLICKATPALRSVVKRWAASS